MTPRTTAAAVAIVTLVCARAAYAATPAPAAQATPMALTLTQAESVALASSPALALARAQYSQAYAGIGEARSGELPNLSVQGSSIRSKSSSRFGSSSTPAPTAFFSTTTTGSVNLNQLILDGGRVNAAVQSARFSTDAAQLQLQRQIQSVQFAVAQAYYATLQARHQLTTARDTLNLAQVQERLVDAQFKAGVASRADVLTALLPVAQAKLAVAQAQFGEQTQVALLLDTMGLPAQTSVTVADETANLITLPPVTDVLDMATRQRPDLLAAQASLDAANASVRSARLGFFPTISGTGSDGTTATKVDVQPGSGTYANSYSVGVTLSVPLFEGGLIRAQTQAAQAVADEASANMRSAQLLVSLNVQQAYLGVQTAEAGLTAADAEYSQARTVLDVTNAQYKSGVTTLPLLLNAQVGLTKAETDQVNAIYTYKTAWQQLLLAEGTIGK